MKKYTLAIGLLLVVAIAAMFFFISDNEKKDIAEDSTTGIQLHYTDPLKQTVLNDQDKQDKFIFRLSSEDPQMLISVRYEDGLEASAALSKQEVLPMLVANAAKAYPKRYPAYELEKETSLTVGGKKAAELKFSYQGTTGEQVKLRQMIIVLDNDRAVYISAQTKSAEFDSLNKQYLDEIFDSVSFN